MDDKIKNMEKDFFFSGFTVVKTLKDTGSKRIDQIYYTPRQTICMLKTYYGRNLSDVYIRLKSVRQENLAAVYDVLFWDGNTYVIEECIDGVTLAERLEHEGVFSEAEVIRITKMLCSALEVLHSQTPPLIHRDIKPGNVMLREDGTVKLIDFDTVRSHKEEASKDTVAMGTREYASPEHYGYGQTGAASDIYSMGVMMHELLTGKLLTEHKASYKGKLLPVIKRCIQVDAKKRFASVKELESALESCQKPWGFLMQDKKMFLYGGILLAAVFLGILYWQGTRETWPDLYKAYEEERSPFLLLENQRVDKGLKKLLGTKYSYVKECLQIIDTDVEYWDGDYFMKGAVPGLYSFMEAAVLLSDDGEIACSFLEDDVCNYYASDERYYEQPNGNMMEWMLSFENKTIQFHQDPWEEGTGEISGTYLQEEPPGSLVLIKNENGDYEVEGRVSRGMYSGDIEGELERINPQQFLYRTGDEETGAKLKLLVYKDRVYAQTIQGVPGGLNVSFDGTYKKQ